LNPDPLTPTSATPLGEQHNYYQSDWQAAWYTEHPSDWQDVKQASDRIGIDANRQATLAWHRYQASSKPLEERLIDGITALSSVWSFNC
jgi:hypothetical protein